MPSSTRPSGSPNGWPASSAIGSAARGAAGSIDAAPLPVSLYGGGVLLLCLLAGFGASKVALDFTGSTDLAALAAIAAFIGNFFMIEPIKSPIIK